MIGLRNRLIHGYFNVNLDIVWDTVKQDLPGLIEVLERLLARLDRSPDRP
ncbi:MAG: HepT-like ribonuclease domain-containing protein [Planctomycetota bacterium]